MKHADPTTEAAVIGALLDAGGPLLSEPSHHLLASSGLRAGDFTDPAWRGCFEALDTLAASRSPAGAIQVWAVAQSLPAVRSVGFERLKAMQDTNALGPADLQTAAESLRRLRQLRELESFHRSQLGAAGQPNVNLAALVQTLQDFGANFTAATESDETADRDLLEILDDWDAAARGERLPIMPTGIDVLDAEIGGWVCNLNVVGGLPSVGKSALVGEVIMNHLRAGFRVGLFGLEDSTKWLSKRHLARAMGLPLRAIGTARLHEHQQGYLQEAAGNIANLTRNLVVHRRAGITATDLLAKCRHWVLNLGVKAIFIDHGGEVHHESSGPRERHDLAVAQTYRHLRDLAVNYRVPVVILCHFNRETERNGKPTPSSFAETAYIERMARVALGLWAVDSEPDALRVTVLKQTEGRRGQTMRLRRDEQCALVHSHGGELVDDQAEREQQKSRRHLRAIPEDA